ncbi:hypothetical protein SSCG_04202 [Streptomyces clavuligerus]|nr:hypothetical protein SSCG_04202 [Streptomyces clavuligerus]
MPDPVPDPRPRSRFPFPSPDPRSRSRSLIPFLVRSRAGPGRALDVYRAGPGAPRPVPFLTHMALPDQRRIAPPVPLLEALISLFPYSRL